MPKVNAKYFIAIVPPEPLATELYRLKQYFADNYSTKAALRSPAHITLQMPFEFREDKESTIANVLTEFTRTKSTFDIELKNYDFFEPKVIYLKVTENPALTELQKDLEQTLKKKLYLFNSSYRNRPFLPHLTVAFRDLKKEQFYKAKLILEKSEINFQFVCDQIALLKHNGKFWEIAGSFLFGDAET